MTKGKYPIADALKLLQVPSWYFHDTVVHAWLKTCCRAICDRVAQVFQWTAECQLSSNVCKWVPSCFTCESRTARESGVHFNDVILKYNRQTLAAQHGAHTHTHTYTKTVLTHIYRWIWVTLLSLWFSFKFFSRPVYLSEQPKTFPISITPYHIHHVILGHCLCFISSISITVQCLIQSVSCPLSMYPTHLTRTFFITKLTIKQLTHDVYTLPLSFNTAHH